MALSRRVDRAKLKALWDRYYTRAQMAEALGVSREAVSYHLAKLGLNRCPTCGVGISQKLKLHPNVDTHV